MNKPSDLKLDTVPVWINGKAVIPQGRMGEVYNPATGQVTKRVPYCSAEVIDAAVKAAAAALPEWRDASILRRARVMQKFLALLQANQKQIATLMVITFSPTGVKVAQKIAMGTTYGVFALRRVGKPPCFDGREIPAAVGEGQDGAATAVAWADCVPSSPAEAHRYRFQRDTLKHGRSIDRTGDFELRSELAGHIASDAHASRMFAVVVLPRPNPGRVTTRFQKAGASELGKFDPKARLN
jgi:hypothetical protein